MSFIGSEDYIRAQFEEYILALLSSVKYDSFLQKHSIPAHEHILPEIGISPLAKNQLTIDGVPVRDFGLAWVNEWRNTSNYAIWMSLTDAELFDIIEPRHPCAGTATLSLEDVQLRVQQKMQDLKLDERMASSKEAISRTWVSSSSKVRGAVGSAWANLDQYRSQRKQTPSTAAVPSDSTTTSMTATEEHQVNGGADGAGGKKESLVGSWAAWAAEKRKKAFQKEEPPRIERPDIGPAPARPLAQWAKRNSEVSAKSTSPTIESINSSDGKSDTNALEEGDETK